MTTCCFARSPCSRRPRPISVIAGVPEDPPQQFTWRRTTHRVARAEGPERIAWEWRRAPEPEPTPSAKAGPARKTEPEPLGELQQLDRTFRDYYRIEDVEGRRYWVYREGAVEAGHADPMVSARSLPVTPP